MAQGTGKDILNVKLSVYCLKFTGKNITIMPGLFDGPCEMNGCWLLIYDGKQTVLTTKYHSLVTISPVKNFNRIDTGLMSFEFEIKRKKPKHMQYFDLYDLKESVMEIVK